MKEDPSTLSNTDNGIIHNWIYTMIPVSPRRLKVEGFSPEIEPLFAAFCKACRTYFTEAMPYSYNAYSTQPVFGQSHLPKYGCHPIDDVTV